MAGPNPPEMDFLLSIPAATKFFAGREASEQSFPDFGKWNNFRNQKFNEKFYEGLM